MKHEFTDEEAVANIQGSQAVIDYFGRWISFIKADLLDIRIHARGNCTIVLYVNDSVGAIADKPRLVRKNALVTFFMEGMNNFHLEGFNNTQNWIGGMSFRRIDSGLHIDLWVDLGTEGWIEAKTIRVEINPLWI
jgi:hypothetical protein